MQETRDQSLLHVLGEYKGVLRELLHAPQTLYTAAIILVITISTTISGSFWAIIDRETAYPCPKSGHLPVRQVRCDPAVLFHRDAASQ